MGASEISRRACALVAVGLMAFAMLTACTTFDGLTADDALPDGVDCGASCGGEHPPGAGCKVPADCESAVCGPDGTCVAATTSDGVKNGTETDVDCGGPGAPKCPPDKACREATDCVWGFCTANVCEGHKPGRQDGDQTDIDCGGTMSPPCDWEKGCLLDTDCTSGACGADKKCLTGPSCRPVHGGSTCGSGEFGEPGKQHESCCRALPVPGYTDPLQPGKAVFLDKYEITAGRMRAFIEAMTSANNGVPDIKGYMAGHRPSRWDSGWENLLPSANVTGEASYTVADPTLDLLYPGQDRYNANLPTIPNWVVASGSYTVETALVYTLGAAHFFPEYQSPIAPTDYPATHNLNCTNEAGSYGYSTYWFDKATIAQYGGGVGKHFSKDDMDEKALNCTPFGLFAAFCAWDGGQLMTSEVFDYIAGGEWPANAGGIPPPPPAPPPRLAGANTSCGSPENTLNTFADGTQSCPAVYFYPDDEGNDYDGSSRIAPPGRVPADRVAINDGDEPWMDLKGNLHEAVLKPDGLFDYRGYGVAWSSVQAHRNQITTPRMKAGSFGARCMRFK
ncbi:MAG: Tryptophan synthase alpha chain [Labilithrix sp.]|nr:Tryptophan synthase alpha chain [Labilithrix sp.]